MPGACSWSVPLPHRYSTSVPAVSVGTLSGMPQQLPLEEVCTYVYNSISADFEFDVSMADSLCPLQSPQVA